MSTGTVILAAGYGTRMESNIPKVLHLANGRSLVEWVIHAAREVSDQRPVIVVGHGKEKVRSALGQTVEYAEQTQLLGTGHALLQAVPYLKGKVDRVIVLYGDMPLIRDVTLQRLVNLFEENSADGKLVLAMLTTHRVDSQGFSRVVRNEEGEVRAVVEEVDCSPEQKIIQELNPGLYCFEGRWLWDNLKHMHISAKGEYYLTSLIEIAVNQGNRVITSEVDQREVYGVNTRSELAIVSDILRGRVLERQMLNGVEIIDPKATYIEDTVRIGAGTVILPGCLIQGDTRIGKDCMIGPNSHIIDSSVGNNCKIAFSMMERANLENNCEVAPFTYLRAQ